MKIAIPENQGLVNQHFGQSRSFALIKIDGVETVIVGGIGQGAIDGLQSRGLNVLFGASGLITEVAESFARGEFVSNKKVCSHHGDHHGGHHSGHHHHG